MPKPKPVERYDPIEEIMSEEERVWANRYQEARAYGFSPDDATTFAGSREDIGRLRKMRDEGVAVELAARILV